MSTVVVRSLPEETHRALKARAVHHGRSTEVEIRAILETAVRPGPSGVSSSVLCWPRSAMRSGALTCGSSATKPQPSRWTSN